MPKIAMIGAGSIVFCKTLFLDMVATPALRNSEFRFMSRTLPKIERMKKFADRVIKANGLSATTMVTLDRREALKDADYVIAMLQVGGVDAFQLDYEIPMKHGVDQCIGDTLGPGGLFRALRTIPVMMAAATTPAAAPTVSTFWFPTRRDSQPNSRFASKLATICTAR